MGDAQSPSRLGRYVPRIAAEWDIDAPGQSWQTLDATLCLADISDFTRISERLASSGRVGSEELTYVLNRVFEGMLRLVHQRSGSLLKFGGDSLLLLFRGPNHAVHAANAAVEIRTALRTSSLVRTSLGRLRLGMSVGIHSGTVHVFRVGRSHDELLVVGPAASMATAMEQAADAGEIVVRTGDGA